MLTLVLHSLGDTITISRDTNKVQLILLLDHLVHMNAHIHDANSMLCSSTAFLREWYGSLVATILTSTVTFSSPLP